MISEAWALKAARGSILAAERVGIRSLLEPLKELLKEIIVRTIKLDKQKRLSREHPLLGLMEDSLKIAGLA